MNQSLSLACLLSASAIFQAHSFFLFLETDSYFSMRFKFSSRGLTFQQVLLNSITAITQSRSGTADCEALITFSRWKEYAFVYIIDSTSLRIFSLMSLISKYKIFSLQTLRKFFIEFQVSSLFPKIVSTAFNTCLTVSGGFINARISSIFFFDNPLTAVLAYSIKG